MNEKTPAVTRQSDILRQACVYIAEHIGMCRNIRLSATRQDYPSWDDEQIRKHLTKEFSAAVEQQVSGFVNRTCGLYKIATDKPALSLKGYTLSVNKRLDGLGVAKDTYMAGSFGAKGGSAAGTLVGAVIAGLLSGGLGAFAGAVVGAKIGAVCGGLFGGGLGAAGGTLFDRKFFAELTDAQLETHVHWCVALNLALSHHRSGLGPDLTPQTVERLQESVKAQARMISSPNGRRAAEGEIAIWCQTVLARCETFEAL